MAETKRMRKVVVTEIAWDVDGIEDAEEVLDTLPDKMEFDVPASWSKDEVEGWLEDAITDETEFCHGGFAWEYAD